MTARSPTEAQATVGEIPPLPSGPAEAAPRPWPGLAVCAALLAASYAALVPVLPGLTSAVPSNSFEILPWARPLTLPALARMHEAEGVVGHMAAAWRFLGLLVVAFAAYGLALRAVSGRSSRATEAAVFGVGLAFQAFAMTAPAMLSIDVYAYASHGESIARYHVAPTVDPPPLAPDNVYLMMTKSGYSAWPYGPAWGMVSAGVVWFSGERAGLTVLLFRGLAVAATLATAASIWWYLRTTAPHRAAQGLVFFLWNPLVFLEVGVGGHNDAVMVALFSLGVWLHVSGRRGTALSAFALSALVKLAMGPLVPIYLLMVLRGLPGWPDRWRFLVRGLGGVALVAGLAFGLLRAWTRSGPEPAPEAARPLAVLALGQDSINSLHELAYPRLRVALGEDRDDARVPSWFVGWWVSPLEATDLRSDPSIGAKPIARIGPGLPLLAIAPQESSWVRVYDLATRKRGFIDGANLADSSRPAEADNDPDLVAWMERETGSSPTARRVNACLRATTWLLFGLAWMAAAWHATDLRRFLVGATALLLASYWLIGSWFWPWYLLWALVPAAMVSDSRPAPLAAITSATVLTLYASIGAPEWVYTYRSLPAFLLPPAVFGLVQAAASLARRKGGAAAPGSPEPWQTF